jgi:hypothetical protein
MITACLAFTISESTLFAPFRSWLKRKSIFLGHLFACGYCLGHWIAFALNLLVHPIFHIHSNEYINFLLTVFLTAWLAGFQWAFMCLLQRLAGK